MFSSFKTGYANGITSAGHLALLVVAWYVDSPPVWAGTLALISIISFFFWVSNLRRNRAIADTPTSKIASAAQGYVELYGTAIGAPEYIARGGRNSFPCVWYRYVVYQRQKDKDGNDTWVEVDRGVSDSTFAIDDGSGRCLIDPDGAEVLTTHSYTTYDGDYKTVEEQLQPGEGVYALGEFVTIGGANTDLNQNEDVAALLAEWKKNSQQLLERFDLNQDGQIDMQEWALARRAAQRDVEKQHREIRSQPGVNVVRAARDGRLFLLSNLSPQQLNRRYFWWGWFHLATFFVTGGAALWLGLGAG
jgi:hypothetical protein